jgi:hypothetical protein
MTNPSSPSNLEESGDPFAASTRHFPPTYPRLAPSGSFVGVLNNKREKRAFQLITPNTRAIRRHEIHEIVVTDETGAAPGGIVNRIAGLGFVEFTEGGILAQGDVLLVGSSAIGEVVGFDESHMPNHQNIIVRGAEVRTGVERGFRLRDAVTFRVQNS